MAKSLIRQLAKNPHYAQNPSMSAMAWSIKGDVKNIFLPPPDAQVYFATSSPSHHGRRSSGVLPLGCSIAVAASSLVATTPISFETHQAVRLYGGSRVGGGALSR